MCDYLHEKDILRKLQCIQTNKIWVKISLVIKKIISEITNARSTGFIGEFCSVNI